MASYQERQRASAVRNKENAQSKIDSTPAVVSLLEGSEINEDPFVVKLIASLTKSAENAAASIVEIDAYIADLDD